MSRNRTLKTLLLLKLCSGKRIDKLEARLNDIESLIRKIPQTSDDTNNVARRPAEYQSLLTNSLSIPSIELEDSLTTSPYQHDRDIHPLSSSRLSGNLGRQIDLSLPPKQDAIYLVEEFLNGFNSVFPLFDPASFTQLVHKLYSDNDRLSKSLGLWAALHVVIALAHMIRAMRAGSLAEEETRKAWRNLTKSLGVVTELAIRDTDMLGIQALLGMALFLQGHKEGVYPAAVLVAASIKLSYRLNLHREDTDQHFTAIQTEQRRRVFWITYFLDKEFSSRLDQPPIQNDDDLDVKLPASFPEDGLGHIYTADRTATINYFRLRVQLSIIQNKIYRKLHSVRALKQSDETRLQSIRDLEIQLEQWKESLPSAFQPETMKQELPSSAILHMVILHLSYFNCMTLVHGMSVQNKDWMTKVLANFGPCLETSLNKAHQGFLSRSRTSIYLITLLSLDDHACTW